MPPPLHRTVRLSRQRRAVIDVLAAASRQQVVHGLVEVDVTDVRTRLAGMQPRPSFTALVTAAVARAVEEHPHVNARRAGRRLVVFDDVDVVVTMERELGGRRAPVPTILRAASRRTVTELSAELGEAAHRPVGGIGQLTGVAVFAHLPPWLRRAVVRAAAHLPAAAARVGPPVGISAIGMFGAGGGWGIPVSPLTLMVTVGGITQRLARVDGEIVDREVLPLTLTFDHAVVDGAPAARFAATLRELVGSPELLEP